MQEGLRRRRRALGLPDPRTSIAGGASFSIIGDGEPAAAPRASHESDGLGNGGGSGSGGSTALVVFEGSGGKAGKRPSAAAVRQRRQALKAEAGEGGVLLEASTALRSRVVSEARAGLLATLSRDEERGRLTGAPGVASAVLASLGTAVGGSSYGGPADKPPLPRAAAGAATSIAGAAVAAATLRGKEKDLDAAAAAAAGAAAAEVNARAEEEASAVADAVADAEAAAEAEAASEQAEQARSGVDVVEADGFLVLRLAATVLRRAADLKDASKLAQVQSALAPLRLLLCVCAAKPFLLLSSIEVDFTLTFPCSNSPHHSTPYFEYRVWLCRLLHFFLASLFASLLDSFARFLA